MANGIEEHGARLRTVEDEVTRLRVWRHNTYTQNYSDILLRLVKMEATLGALSATSSADRSKVWEIVKPLVIGFVLWLASVLLHLYPIK